MQVYTVMSTAVQGSLFASDKLINDVGDRSAHCSTYDEEITVDTEASMGKWR